MATPTQRMQLRYVHAQPPLGTGYTKVVLPPHMRRRSIKSSNYPQIPISGLVKRSHTHETTAAMEVYHHRKSEEDILASASFVDRELEHGTLKSLQL